MVMDMEWMWRPYDEKARADEIAERKLAEHQAYLKQEEERRARQEEMRRQQEIAEAAQGAKEYADRQAAASMGLSQLPQYTMGQAQAALYDQMAHEADVARFQQLAAKREARQRKMLDDPNFKMAAMLAMGGQPGALQSMLTMDAQAKANGNSSKAQTDMDALEEKMVNDIFALSSADPDQFSKITGALIPLYKDKFEETQKKGGKSRLGGWEKWEAAINGAVASKQDKDEKAARNKKNNKTAADLM